MHSAQVSVAALPKTSAWCAGLGLAACGLLITVPFLVPWHYYPLNLFYAEWTAFVLGLAAMLAVFIAGSGRAVVLPGVAVGLLALVLVVAVQLAMGRVTYNEVALMVGFYMVWAALLAVAGAQLRDLLGEERVLVTLRNVLGVGGALAAVLGFVQYYQIDTPWGYMVVKEYQATILMIGTVAQHNTFANYVTCGLVSVLFMHAGGALKRLPTALLVVVMSAAVVLAVSRTAFLYVVVVAVAIVALRRSHPREFAALWKFGLLALAVAVAVQLLLANTDVLTGPQGRSETVLGRLMSQMNDSGGNIRLALFAKAWAAFLSQPLLGIGAGELAWNMFWQTPDLPPPQPNLVIDRYAHNLVLQLLAEYGLVGAVVILAPLAMWAWALWRGPVTLNRVWLFAVLGIIAAHSMVEFPLWIAHFLGLFALLLGAGSVRAAPAHNARGLRAGLLVLCLGGAVAAGKYFLDYRDYEGWYLRLEAKERSGRLPDGGDLMMLMIFHDRSWFSHYFERVASEAIVLDREGLVEKLAFNTQVMHYFPNPSVVERQIVLLGLADRPGEARRVARALEQLWPAEAVAWLPTFERVARKFPAQLSGLAQYLRQLIADRDVQLGRKSLPS